MHLVEILLPLNDNSGRPFRTGKYTAGPLAPGGTLRRTDGI
jgi:hypothetical protein